MISIRVTGKGREKGTHLGEPPRKDEERERVRVIRHRQGREDRELGRDEHDAQPDPERDLHAEVHRAARVRVQEREHAERDEDDRPAEVVLRAVLAEALHGGAERDRGDGGHEGEGQDVDPRTDCGCALDGLEVYGEVICKAGSLC